VCGCAVRRVPGFAGAAGARYGAPGGAGRIGRIALLAGNRSPLGVSNEGAISPNNAIQRNVGPPDRSPPPSTENASGRSRGGAVFWPYPRWMG